VSLCVFTCMHPTGDQSLSVFVRFLVNESSCETIKDGFALPTK
jgi:hypothetical protein